MDGNVQNQKDFPSLFPKCSDHVPDLGQCTEQILRLTFTFQSSIEGGQEGATGESGGDYLPGWSMECHLHRP